MKQTVTPRLACSDVSVSHESCSLLHKCRSSTSSLPSETPRSVLVGIPLESTSKYRILINEPSKVAPLYERTMIVGCLVNNDPLIHEFLCLLEENNIILIL